MCATPPIGPIGRTRRSRFAIKRFVADERGETAIEYGLIASLIVVAILTALSQFSSATTKLYNKISNTMAGTP